MTYDCDCCEGISPLTPRAIVNRPGLDALTYRVGTHHSFLQTMLARLSSQQFLALANLKTRETDDFAIALLDSWATVADVLTFYQERIANEGYLRTATERRSVLELARLVGYQLRPGVSASVYLAFSLEKDFNDDNVFIPAGTQAQSIPGPDELPQTFETEKDEPARTVWNQFQPRLTRPQFIDQTNAPVVSVIYAEGILTDLKANDRLAFVFKDSIANNDSLTVRSVRGVEPQTADQHTKITLIETTSPVQQPLEREGSDELPKSLAPIRAISQQQLKALGKPPVIPPANALRLTRSTAQAFDLATDIAPNLLTKFQRFAKDSFYTAWQNTPVTDPAPLSSTEVFKVKAAPFGHNAAPKTVYDSEGRPVGTEEWGLESVKFGVEIFLREDQPLSIRVFMVERGRLFNGRATADQETGEIPPITLSNDVRVRVTMPTPGLAGTTIPDLIRFDFEDSTGQLLKQFRILSPGTTGGSDDVISLRAFSLRAAPLAMAVAVAEPVFRVQVDSDMPQPIGFGQQFSYTVEIRQVFVDFGRARFLMQDSGEGAVLPGRRNVLALDTQYDKILPGSWVVLEQPSRAARPFRVDEVQTVSLNRYGLTGKVTQLLLSGDWLTQDDIYLSSIQDVTIYAQSEPLTLAEEVIDPIAYPVKGDEIELSALYDGLQAGRWLIVSGERTDILNASSVPVPGVKGIELVMLAAVRQGVGVVTSSTSANDDDNEPESLAIPGDKTHSFLQLEKPLEYAYKRDTVTVYGNVVKATHGETRQEVLGSGDSGQSFQQFTLRQPPLTFVSAPTPSGVDSTLEVLVNQVQWPEVESLGGLGPDSRAFITRNDNDGNTQITFGDGHRGLRLPTGIENVRAKYRSGLGKGGNVKAEQISLLASRPLGVKDVINPLAATGGADPESRDQARRNAPLAVMALDRLVSVQDYEDFTRTFAGIGKASVAPLSDGRRQVIHLTIAGEDDIPIAPTSDLYRNLQLALRTYGSPNRWVQVALRDLMLLLIAVKVRILPDYRWEFVAPAIRTALLDTFSFERRSLGQAVRSSEVIAAIHRVPGVDYVDLDVLGSIAESEVVGASDDPKENPPPWLDKLEAIAGTDPLPPAPVIPVNLAHIDPDSGTLIPAQLAILSPEIPDTLKIEELAHE